MRREKVDLSPEFKYKLVNGLRSWSSILRFTFRLRPGSFLQFTETITISVIRYNQRVSPLVIRLPGRHVIRELFQDGHHAAPPICVLRIRHQQMPLHEATLESDRIKLTSFIPSLYAQTYVDKLKTGPDLHRWFPFDRSTLG